MKFGIGFANIMHFGTGEGAATLGRAAVAAGFDSVWTVEHIVYPEGYESSYPYSPDGKMPGSGDSPIPDPLVWLAFVAAATSELKLATGISLVPERSPLVFAKEVAGYPTVFAHGMLTMGMTGRILTDTLGDGRLLSFGGRFTSQVFPGDTLTATATVESVEAGDDGPVVHLTVATTNQDGVVVFSGQASGRLDP